MTRIPFELPRILVTGGRDFGREFNESAFIFSCMDHIHEEYGQFHLIHGGAPGADFTADKWAKQREIIHTCHSAEWRRHEKAAGPIRNEEMLFWDLSLVVVFPGGKGTADMKQRAEKEGLNIREFLP